ncbi:MAG: hypothetical protein AAGC96_03510 [Pseudomonadota bacterium]
MRAMLISWAAAWPTITVLLLLFDGVFAGLPLVLRTLILTGLMVPLMKLILVPVLNGGIAYLERRSVL